MRTGGRPWRLMRARHRLSKLLLRHGRVFEARAWTLAHDAWLRRQVFDHAGSAAGSAWAADAADDRRRARRCPTRDHAGVGGAALNMFRMVGLALGIVTMGVILAATDPAGLAGGFSRGLSTGLLVSAVIALAAAGLALATIGGGMHVVAPAPRPAS